MSGLVLAAYLLLRYTVLGGLAMIEIEPLDNPLVDLQGIDRVLAALAVATRYAVLLVVPARLSADYSFAAIDVSALPIVEIAGLRCGLLVCFDVEFPELCRDLALRGAKAIIVPTALPKSDGARFIAQNVVPVRAFENQLFVVYADHCGSDGTFAVSSAWLSVSKHKMSVNVPPTSIPTR